MSKRSGILLALALVAGLALVAPTLGQSDGIIVDAADDMTTLTVSTLTETPVLSGPRLVLWYADAIHFRDVAQVPQPLIGLLAAVPPRFIWWYADAVRSWDISPVPGLLSALLDNVPPRMTLWYADGKRQYGLGYPREIVGDYTAPVLTDVAASALGSDSLIISWTSNEFANSAVDYGIEPGVYTGSVSDVLYVKQHELTVVGVSLESTIYFRVRSADQSGNAAQSSEYSYSPEMRAYLPVVLRDYP